MCFLCTRTRVFNQKFNEILGKGLTYALSSACACEFHRCDNVGSKSAHTLALARTLTQLNGFNEVDISKCSALSPTLHHPLASPTAFMAKIAECKLRDQPASQPPTRKMGANQNIGGT